MKVVWTPEALQDRFDIWEYIALEKPGAAARLDELFSISVARLAEHPKLGPQGIIAGTRELIPHESYRIIYEINDESVWILALVHTSQQWPSLNRLDADHFMFQDKCFS